MIVYHNDEQEKLETEHYGSDPSRKKRFCNFSDMTVAQDMTGTLGAAGGVGEPDHICPVQRSSTLWQGEVKDTEPVERGNFKRTLYGHLLVDRLKAKVTGEERAL